jgi:hypothetical protein
LAVADMVRRIPELLEQAAVIQLLVLLPLLVVAGALVMGRRLLQVVLVAVDQTLGVQPQRARLAIILLHLQYKVMLAVMALILAIT